MSDKQLPPTPESFSAAMKELETLNAWFQQDNLDLELGLEELQRANILIKYCQERLTKLENEFDKVKGETLQN